MKLDNDTALKGLRRKNGRGSSKQTAREKNKPDSKFPIVGIGASAGGLGISVGQ